jgi:hypothetical protein
MGLFNEKAVPHRTERRLPGLSSLFAARASIHGGHPQGADARFTALMGKYVGCPHHVPTTPPIDPITIPLWLIKNLFSLT